MRTSLAPFAVLALTLALAAAGCSSWPGPEPVPADVASTPGAPPPLGIRNFAVIEPGIAASAQPSREALAAAAAAGYRRVVDLRTDAESPHPDEEGAVVRELGMEYVRIPVAGADVRPEHADALAAAIGDAAEAPVLVHCASANRTGAVWSLYLVRHRGVAPEDALREGERIGMSAEMRERVAPLLSTR